MDGGFLVVFLQPMFTVEYLAAWNTIPMRVLVVLRKLPLAAVMEATSLAIGVNTLLLNKVLFESCEGGEINIAVIADMMLIGVVYMLFKAVIIPAAAVTVFCMLLFVMLVESWESEEI